VQNNPDQKNQAESPGRQGMLFCFQMVIVVFGRSFCCGPYKMEDGAPLWFL
jgi:hypothetical protein